MSGKRDSRGDKFDYFLSMADKNINYWDSYVRTVNPYNPHGLQAEFNITIVEESKMLEIKNKMMKDYGVKGTEDLKLDF